MCNIPSFQNNVLLWIYIYLIRRKMKRNVTLGVFVCSTKAATFLVKSGKTSSSIGNAFIPIESRIIQHFLCVLFLAGVRSCSGFIPVQY